MRNNDIEFICVFTTGRSGTALLSQVFGGNLWEKRKYHYKNNNLVCHEAWDTKDIPIPELKEEPSLSTDRAMSLQKNFIDKQIEIAQKEYPDMKKYFVTDMRIGRFFSHYVSKLPKSKIIYIERDRKEVVNSFMKRWNDRLELYGQEKFEHFQKRAWDLNFYKATDRCSVSHMSPILWNSLYLERKLEWYWIECKIQWHHFLRNTNFQNVYIAKFKDMITEEGMRDLESFLEMPLYKDLLSIKANDRNQIRERI